MYSLNINTEKDDTDKADEVTIIIGNQYYKEWEKQKAHQKHNSASRNSFSQEENFIIGISNQEEIP